MIRHAVLFKWKAGTTLEQVQALAAGLARLPAEIPEIAAYRFGSDLGQAEGNADFAIVADFASVEDWRSYVQHPAHVRLIEEYILPIRESRAVLQYEFEA